MLIDFWHKNAPIYFIKKADIPYEHRKIDFENKILKTLTMYKKL